ncbi:MAG: ribonuclease III [Planctomycetes bacterium]|nr:ribonuclease III [Planctomycetota bacterium]
MSGFRHPPDLFSIGDESNMRDEALPAVKRRSAFDSRSRNCFLPRLTHASIADNRLQSNERLEFLGDAILGMIVCQYLYDNYPDFLEGELTKIKSTVVSGKTCAKISEQLGLADHLFLGNGISARSKLPTSVMAAVFESLIAAIYLDAGLEKTRKFILVHVEPFIRSAAVSEHHQNFKSQLQQYAQRDMAATPVYDMLDEKGPDHSKCFEVAVSIAGRQFTGAWGPSKKEAEQKAAYNALIELNLIPQETVVN